MRLKRRILDFNKSAASYWAWCLIPFLVAPNVGRAETAKVASYTEADVVRDIAYIPMKDGTRIAYVSYYPKHGRHPTVFIFSPYTASATPFEVAKPYLDAGYAFVGANIPATGCSEGVIDHWWMRIEGVTGAEAVEWIAKQPWSDGNVGMVGNSSEGQVQLRIAAERPPHLRAIVPAGIEDGYDNVGYMGGMMQLGLGAWALRSQFGSEPRGVAWRISHGDTECAKIRGSDRQVVKHSFADGMREHPLNDEWWDTVTVERAQNISDITVPTMMVGAFQDEYGGATREGVRIFDRLLPNVKNKKLVLMNGSHGSGDPNRGYGFIHTEAMKFLNRWVRGIKNGIDREPPVKVFWEVRAPGGELKNAVPGWVTLHKTWPDPLVQRRSFFLSADGALTPEHDASSPTEGARAYLYPMGVELVGNDKQFAVKPYSVGVLNYRTAPVPEDVALLGNPELDLYLSIESGDDTDLEITVKDVAPDGTVLYLQSGLQRASLREVDEQQTYSDEVVHTFKKPEKLVPGKVYEVRMSLLGSFAHVLRKGHSLELTVGAPNPIPHPSIASIPVGTMSINRIYQSKTYPSKIVLPILPGGVAKAPAPECGTLSNQPCRQDAGFVPGGLPLP